MTDYERKKIEMDLKHFNSRHLEKPSDCRNPEQVRFYVEELSRKIAELEQRRNYAPDWAYALLAQYNARQNSFVLAEFSNSYR